MQYRNALGLVIAIKYVHIYIYYRVCHTNREETPINSADRITLPHTHGRNKDTGLKRKEL